MKLIVTTLLAILLTISVKAQTDSLLNSLDTPEANQQALFPKKMILTQKLAWGPHGLLRGGKEVTAETRERDMHIRRKMLIAHQVLGFTTLAGFVAQGIVGSQLYNDPYNRKLKSAHELLATTVNTTYSLTAVMSLFAPPSLVERDKGITTIRLHKWLAIVHMSGMIATNILATQLEQHPNLRPYHRAAAYTTFAAFTAAMVVIKF